MAVPQRISLDQLPIHAPFEIVGHGFERGAITTTPEELLESFVYDNDVTDPYEISDIRNTIETIGISDLPRVGDGQTVEDLGTIAAKKALDTAGISAKDISLLIFASSTQSRIVPEASKTVHGRLGMSGDCHSFYLSNACQAGLDAMMAAASMINGLPYRTDYALVIGADVISRELDPSNLSQRAIFSDVGAATVIKRDVNADSGVVLFGPVTDSGASEDLTLERDPSKKMTMNPSDVGRTIIKLVKESMRVATDVTNPRYDIDLTIDPEVPKIIDMSQMALLIAHQANSRMLKPFFKAFKQVGVPQELIPDVFHYIGNPSAANCMSVMSMMIEAERINKGSYMGVVSAAVGSSALNTVIKY